MKHLLIILLTTLALHAPAQDKDSLFAAQSKIEGLKYLSILDGRELQVC